MRPTYFASGSNVPADIRGFAAIGHPIGVAAHQLSVRAVDELLALAGTGLPVFVDSGAFSEIVFGAAGPEVVRPIDEAGWRRRLALYARLAAALGPQAYLVAPDRIGDQERTLYLLSHFKKELRELAAAGANILVPIQKGTRTQADFAATARAVLGFDFVHAVPSKKNATTLGELKAFMAAAKPARVHLLGMGPRNRLAEEALAIISSAVPGCEVSMDSNLITANVGRQGSAPRKLTAARDRAKALIEGGLHGYLSAQELGIVLAFGSPADVAAVEFKAAVVPRAIELARSLTGIEVTVTGVQSAA